MVKKTDKVFVKSEGKHFYLTKNCQKICLNVEDGLNSFLMGYLRVALKHDFFVIEKKGTLEDAKHVLITKPKDNEFEVFCKNM